MQRTAGMISKAARSSSVGFCRNRRRLMIMDRGSSRYLMGARDMSVVV